MKVDIPDPTGQGGTSTSGPVVKRLFGEEMSVLIQLVPEKHRATFERFITNLNCLLLCYSSNREVDVELYKKLVGEVYNDILRNFNTPTGSPWVYPSPTLHGFLSHSLQLIEENQNMGLGKYSEQELENNNKLLRLFRKTLARKSSQEENLANCFSRLWLQSDPVIRRSGRTIKHTLRRSVTTVPNKTESIKKELLLS